MQVLSPFQILADISAKCHELAQGLPSQEVVEQNWSGIGFKLGNNYFVAEILPEPTFATIPGVKPWVRGLANVRGNLLPLFDLGGLLGQQFSTTQRAHRVLIVEHQNIFAGLIVDAMLGMQVFKMDSFNPNLPVLPELIIEFVDGFYLAEQKWFRFDFLRLVQSTLFFSVASGL